MQRGAGWLLFPTRVRIRPRRKCDHPTTLSASCRCLAELWHSDVGV